MQTVHLSVFSFGKKTKFLCDHRIKVNRHTNLSKNQQTPQATMAQSAARKSHNLKVVSSSLTGRSSRKKFSFAFNRIMKYRKKQEKKKTRKTYNQLRRSEPNWLLLVQLKINPLKKSDFPQSRKKRLTNARDLHMKTVHFSVFSFGKKTKFLCDNRTNGNRHTKE